MGSCFVSGVPVPPSPPQRLVYLDSTVNGVPEIIALNHQLQHMYMLNQLTFTIEPASVSAGLITLVKSIGGAYDVLMAEFDPIALLQTDFIILDPFVWDTGDLILFDYANPDDRACRVEIILTRMN